MREREIVTGLSRSLPGFPPEVSICAWTNLKKAEGALYTGDDGGGVGSNEQNLLSLSLSLSLSPISLAPSFCLPVSSLAAPQ